MTYIPKYICTYACTSYRVCFHTHLTKQTHKTGRRSSASPCSYPGDLLSACAHTRTHMYTLMRTCNLLSLPPPFAKGILYQRPNKLSEMNHYIPKYRLRSDLRMKNNITSTLWVLNTFDVKQFSSFKALVLTWDSPITLLIHLFRM